MIFNRNNACDRIYDSLDVRFTRVCDNRCRFCIEQNGIDALEEAPVSKLVYSTIASGIRSVLILGGEPLLRIPRVLEYVQQIRDKVDTIYLTTSLPATIYANYDMFEELMSLLDGLNVSIQSIWPEENNLILRASSKHNRLELLKRINSRWADKVRTSINLTWNGIDSDAELSYTCRTLEKEYGCKHIKINELQHAEAQYVSYEEIMQCKLPPPYSTGCQTEVTMKGVTAKLVLKRSCFLTESTLKASWRDLIKALCNWVYKPRNKFAVMYEDGRRLPYWQMKRKEEKQQ